MDLKEKVLQYYRIEEERESEDLHAKLLRLTHIGTGARIAVISNEDENKVFSIGFRTPPSDSTGVPHILEHSVLCGSREFPVKDPFIELAKGSLNTFLNAMTYPDRTVYPVASCNDQDFQNLMHVYLDAVFYPNIYQEPNIFKQEGWHYELEDLDAPLTVNGVVYNEMKGAFSSAEDVMERAVMDSLYPDTCYGVESGGDPEVIPELSYEQFLHFHSMLYHPSNSFIYLYGNMDVWEKLDFIQEHYLSHFSKEDEVSRVLNSEVALQKPFEKPVEIVKPYPVMPGEDTKDKAFLTYNVSAGTSLDVELCVALQVLDYALCSAPGAPVKQALVDAGIGKDIYSTYEDGIYQPYFSIVAKDAEESRKEEFVAIIERELKKIVEEGFDPMALKAALHYFEFRYREADFGRWPKGLMYGLQTMDTWNYASDQPFLHLELGNLYAALNEKAKTGYFEKLVDTYLLKNTHKSILVMSPKPGLTEEREQAFCEKMAKRKASMTEQELKDILADKEALERWQDTQDTPENLSKIPVLKREDLKKEALRYVNDLKEAGGVRVLTHPIYTNRIAYLRLLFDTKHVPGDLFPYISLLRACLGYMDTEHYSYSQLFNKINLLTGGMETVSNIYTQAEDFEQATVTLELKCKVMYQDMEEAVSLMEEMLLHTKFDDKKRLLEIISEGKSRMQGQMMSGGHTVAASRAMSYFSRTGAISETMNGISFYRLLEDMERNFEEKSDRIIANLEALCHMIFRKENLLADVTAEEEGVEAWMRFVPQIADQLYTNPVRTGSFTPILKKKNEGLMTSGQVQYVCRAGNFYKKGYDYTGALKVLKVMMGYEYLWTQIRVKGGAYGCMCAFGKTGDSYFVSYRDPNLDKTIEVYEKAADAIAAFEADERTMNQYVIGAVSELDTPLTPAGLGLFSLSGFMTGRTEEDIQTERDQILTCSVEDIRRLAEPVRAFMSDDMLCVVGNADKITKAKADFMKKEQLF